MKIPFILFKNKQPWQWTSCKHPKTLSFRATANNVDHVFKTVNSVFIDISDTIKPPESYRFTNSSSSNYATSTTTTAAAAAFSDENNSSSLEMIIQGLRQSDYERLFFEPGYTSSSIVKGEIIVNNNKELEVTSNIIVDDGNVSVVVVAMESDNPYLDFKKSMSEMLENQGLMKDWDCLVELLRWYLRINSSKNHAFIVAAFLDLLVPSSSSPPSSTAECCSDSTSYCSADSCFSSASSSPFYHVGE